MRVASSAKGVASPIPATGIRNVRRSTRVSAALLACLLPVTGCTGSSDDTAPFRHLETFASVGGLPAGWWSLDIDGKRASWTTPTGWRMVMGEVVRLTDVELEVGPDPGCRSDDGGLYKITRHGDGIEFGAIRDGCPDREQILTASEWRPYEPPRQLTDVPDVRPAPVLSTVPVDHEPRRLTYIQGSLWVTAGTAPVVYRVDPLDARVVGVVQTAATDEFRGIGTSTDHVWMTDWVAGTVSRIDPASNAITETLRVGDAPNDALETAGGVWVTNGHAGSISRIDPGTVAVTDTIEVCDPGNAGPQSLVEWRGDLYVAIPKTSEIVRLDPTTGEVSPFFSGRILSRLTATADSLWTIEGGDATWISRLSSDGTVDLRVDVGKGRRPRALESADGAVWALTVAEEVPGARVELLRVDARSGEITRREDVSGWTPMQDMAIDDAGNVWVPTEDSIVQIDGRAGD